MDFEQLRTMVSKAVGSRHIEDGTVYQYNDLMVDIMKAVWPAIEQGNAARKSLADVWELNAAEFDEAGQSDRADAFRECAAEIRQYAAQQPSEQQPAPAVEALVEALDDIAKLPIDPCSTENDYRLPAAKAMANAALAAYREGGEK